MIFKAQVIAEAIRHVGHLCKVRDPNRPETADWNDEIEIVCAHNLFAGTDLKAAVQEMAAVAAGSICTKPYYTVAINPDRPSSQELTNAEAEYVAKNLLKELGFSLEHQWFLVRHQKHGRMHYHLVANRVDLTTLKAVHLGWNYRIQERVARALELFFGLTPVPCSFGDRSGTRVGKTRLARRKRNQKEEQQAKRTAIPVQTVEADLAWAWENSTCGAKFLFRLGERGYQLAKGERRDWVVLDAMGGIHSPCRRLGIRPAELRERTQDLAEIELPSIDAYRAELSRVDQAAESVHDTPHGVLDIETTQDPAPEIKT